MTDMRVYMNNRRNERRLLLKEMLGNHCVDCGADDELEFDHIDPSTKSFAISRGLHKNWDLLVEEALKCKLRCRSCHKIRTSKEGHYRRFGPDNPMWVEALHGTAKMYQQCKCDKCRAWKRQYRLGIVDSRGHPVE